MNWIRCATCKTRQFEGLRKACYACGRDLADATPSDPPPRGHVEGQGSADATSASYALSALGVLGAAGIIPIFIAGIASVVDGGGSCLGAFLLLILCVVAVLLGIGSWIWRRRAKSHEAERTSKRLAVVLLLTLAYAAGGFLLLFVACATVIS